MAKVKTKENVDVKNRILEASEDLFSSKGYDATSIDQIAKKAEVTKSLIYYYFEGKEKILEELISKYLLATINEKKDILTGNASDSRLIEQSMQKGFSFLTKNKRIIRILLAEMLKNNTRNESLFKSIEDMITASTVNLKSLGVNIKDERQFAMYSFFFGLAPLISYMLFGDAWIKNSKLDSEECNNQFYNMMKAALCNDVTGIKSDFLDPMNSTIRENLKELLEE